MTRAELAKLTVTELKALAKKIKVALPSGLTKPKIVSSLAAAVGKAAKAVSGRKKTVAAKGNGKAARKPAAAKRAKSPAGKGRSAPKGIETSAVAVRRPVTRKSPVGEWQMPPAREDAATAQERVSNAKFYTGGEEKPAGPYDVLPHEYGQERLALLARDPHTVFAYWEVPLSRLDQARTLLGGDARLCIRVYDVTGVSFNGGNEVGYFDQEVYERIGSWYFDLGRAGHSFCADLGIRTPDGRFQALARSNTVAVPREGFSEVIDEEWMAVEEEFLRLYGLSRKSLGGMSSAQVQELLQELRRKRKMLEVSSPGQFGRRREQPSHK